MTAAISYVKTLKEAKPKFGTTGFAWADASLF